MNKLAGKVDIAFTKTYATAANAEKAVDAYFSKFESKTELNVRVCNYFIVPVIVKRGMVEEIRYGVMLCGIESGRPFSICVASGFNMVN